jgi:hypothetical protein
MLSVRPGADLGRCEHLVGASMVVWRRVSPDNAEEATWN